MSRRSLPITPVSSPLRPGPTRAPQPPQPPQPPQYAQHPQPPQYPQPSRSQGGAAQRSQAQRSQAQGVPLCKFDEHMMSLIPTYKPLDQQQLNDFLLLCGATEDTMDETLKSYNYICEQKIRTAGVKVIGVKPLPDDPNVYSVRIPNSPYAIRMWDGGMDYWGQFCLDFLDVERKVSVNLPPGYGLYLAGVMTMPPGIGPAHPFPQRLLRTNVRPAKCLPLGSWERNMGITPIPDGEEKWSFPEGTRLTLSRDNQPPLSFQVPTRQVPVPVIQPRMGRPF